jgi:hypothetical protein
MCVRIVCGVGALLAAGFLAAAALALDVPVVPGLPTITAPTLTAPTLTTPTLPAPLPPPTTVTVAPVPGPTVSTPSLPAPTVTTATAPGTTSTAPAAAAPAPSPSGTTSGAARETPAAGPSGTPAPGSQPGSTSRASQGTYGSRVAAGDVRRSAKPFRPVVARFRVAHALRLRVFVRQVAPVCRRIGAYSFTAERGTNAVRLPRRIGRHRLGAGTYVLTGKHGSRRVFRARAQVVRGRTLVVHRGGPVAACQSPTLLLATTGAAAGTATTEKPTPDREGRGVKSARESSPYVPSQHVPRHSPLIRTIGLENAPDALRPLLLALLALSIGLLAAAALPQNALPAGPVAAFVAHRRGYIVAAGIWLLAVVAVVTTFA